LIDALGAPYHGAERESETMDAEGTTPGAGNRRAASSIRAAAMAGGLRLFAVDGLTVVLPDGQRVCGAGPAAATVRLHTWRAALTFALRDQLGLFEAYVDSQVDVDPLPGEDEAAAFLAALKAGDEQWKDFRLLSAALHSSRFFWQQNTEARRAKLAVHYSIPEDFWLAFMSKEYPIYSHYLFEEEESFRDWEKACQRKLQFALDTCRARPGDRVLNIGEGWGGMLTYAGRRGIRLTGVTLNEESYKACLAKREKEGLAGTCEVIRTDFYHFHPVTMGPQAAPYPARSRAPDGRFDAITNMGVTEHLTDYDALMAQYARLLRSGGYVYSDFVGVTRDVPFRSLIQKDVYPGAAAVYLPKLIAAAARNGQMDVVATYDDRLSYDKTCEAWARNVEASRDVIVPRFGAARYRWMWSYLWMCVHGFRTYDNGITGTRVVLRRR
jgi:cyclopropane-fatty-acyl-phospholipid synthase